MQRDFGWVFGENFGMRFSVNVVAAIAAAAVFGAAAAPASAECKRYGFTVNDYGKDGPTKDAKELLDKLIASKMSEKGVKDFHTGKKSVACEQFLNFIVFDEHTCTAEATVCWGGTPLPNSEEAAVEANTATKTSSDDTATPKPSKKKKKDAAADAPVLKTAKAASETKPFVRTIPDPKSAAVQQAQKNADQKNEAAEPHAAVDAATADAAKAAASTTAHEPSTPAAKPVETGSLSEMASKPAAKHKAEKEKPAEDSGVVAPIKQKANDAGYPTPVAPLGDSPNP